MRAIKLLGGLEPAEVEVPPAPTSARPGKRRPTTSTASSAVNVVGLTLTEERLSTGLYEEYTPMQMRSGAADKRHPDELVSETTTNDAQGRPGLTKVVRVAPGESLELDKVNATYRSELASARKSYLTFFRTLQR